MYQTVITCFEQHISLQDVEQDGKIKAEVINAGPAHGLALNRRRAR